MLVSTKAVMLSRTMVDLAIHGDGEPVKIKDIANRQGYPVNIWADYLYLIQSRICAQHQGKSGGLLSGQTVIGLYGGFHFENHRGKPGSVDCLSGDENPCARADGMCGPCACGGSWMRLSAAWWINIHWRIWSSGKKHEG